MRAIPLIISIFSFCMAIIYLYTPKVILKINEFVRKYIFSDTLALFSRKKIAVIYFFISLTSLYIYLSIPLMENKYQITLELSSAYRNYYIGKYEKVIKICNKILSCEPHNIKANELLGLTYLALNQNTTAKAYLMEVIKRNPKNERIKKIIDNLK